MDQFTDNEYTNERILRQQGLLTTWEEDIAEVKEFNREYPGIAWAIEEYLTIKQRDEERESNSMTRAFGYSLGSLIMGVACPPLAITGIACMTLVTVVGFMTQDCD